MERRVFFANRPELLTRILILSGVLNLIFLAIFFYFLVRENPFPISYEYPPSTEKLEKSKNISNKELLKNFAALSYGTLVSKLSDTTQIDDGYQVRDLALAMLFSKYHFDVRRALGLRQTPTRYVMINEKNAITLFPDLRDDDYKKIDAFIAKERFPLTTRGLFLTLKKVGIAGNEALAQTFCRTNEFLLCETLFHKTKAQVKKKWLLTLILEGKWETLRAFHEKQKSALNLGDEGRRAFLHSYLMAGSKTAAQFFLLTDWEYAVNKLDDTSIGKMLDQLPVNSQRGALFAKELLEHPRGDFVHSKARAKLQTGQPIAQIRPPRAAVGELRPVQRNLPTASPTPKQHIIKNGETLPLIAQKYHTTVENLMRINHLPSTTIRTGNILKLP